MPISISNLTTRTATVDVYKKLGAAKDLWGKLNVEYYLTPDWNLEQDAERQAAVNGGDDEAISLQNAKYSATLIASWDLQDDDKQTIELTPEAIVNQVPTGILTDVHNAINKDRGSAAASKKR